MAFSRVVLNIIVSPFVDVVKRLADLIQHGRSVSAQNSKDFLACQLSLLLVHGLGKVVGWVSLGKENPDLRQISGELPILIARPTQPTLLSSDFAGTLAAGDRNCDEQHEYGGDHGRTETPGTDSMDYEKLQAG